MTPNTNPAPGRLGNASTLTIGIIERYIMLKLRKCIEDHIRGAVEEAINDVVRGIEIRWANDCLNVHVTLGNPELVDMKERL